MAVTRCESESGGESAMKKILITATAAVFGFASVYLFCAFVKFSFDVGAWETYERLCMGVMAIAVAAGCALLAGES